MSGLSQELEDTEGRLHTALDEFQNCYEATTALVEFFGEAVHAIENGVLDKQLADDKENEEPQSISDWLYENTEMSRSVDYTDVCDALEDVDEDVLEYEHVQSIWDNSGKDAVVELFENALEVLQYNIDNLDYDIVCLVE